MTLITTRITIIIMIMIMIIIIIKKVITIKIITICNNSVNDNINEGC